MKSGRPQKFNGANDQQTSAIGGSGTRRSFSKKGEAVASQKLEDILARSSGQQVTATVASGARYTGILLAADISPSGNGALSIVIAHPELTLKAVLNDKSNADSSLPRELVIQAKDLIDVELTVPVTKASPTSDAKADNKAESKPDAKTEGAKVEVAEKITVNPAGSQSAVRKPSPAPEIATSASTAPPPTPQSASKFRTDADIASTQQVRERELQRWVPEEPAAELTWEDPGTRHRNGGEAAWDQFKVNEDKFGVESSYDEHLYTTRIDKLAPDYEERLKRAQRIAREIEGLTTTDLHVLEERGVQVDDSGMDEEDKYSGVANANVPEPKDTRGSELMAALKRTSISRETSSQEPRDAKTNRYTTPRQRAAQYHNDPAIISSSATGESTEIKAAAESKKPVAQPMSSASPDPDKATGGNVEAKRESASVPKQGAREAFRLNAESEINALREFSANFKVPHKMPTDLLPILAKDKSKQSEILRKQDSVSSPVSGTPKVASPAGTKVSTAPTPKKENRFKLNPNAASFTPSAKFPPQISPNPPRAQFHRMGNSASPRMGNQRPYANQQYGTPGKRHHQATAAEFFGGANKVPTAASQKVKLKMIKEQFNMFNTARKNHKGDGPVVLEKTYHTPPTWDSTVDVPYDEFLVEHMVSSEKLGPLPLPTAPAMPGYVMVPGMNPQMGGYPAGVKPYGMNPQSRANMVHSQHPHQQHQQHQQQMQAAMFYLQFQPGMNPGQSPFVYAPRGIEPQFLPPGGYSMPGYGAPMSPSKASTPDASILGSSGLDG